jgi:hypothetical protein
MPTVHFRNLLHAANLRHGTPGFTSLPKKGVLRIFPPLKIRRLGPGLNPRTWVPEASTLTPRPPKPLYLLYFLTYLFTYWMKLCFHTVAVVLTVGQTKLLRINVKIRITERHYQYLNTGTRRRGRLASHLFQAARRKEEKPVAQGI